MTGSNGKMRELRTSPGLQVLFRMCRLVGGGGGAVFCSWPQILVNGPGLSWVVLRVCVPWLASPGLPLGVPLFVPALPASQG